jgi:RNA polymerase sporulation-specific sigma factor
MNLPHFPLLSNDETLQWIQKVRLGDEPAREHLVHSNLRLVFTLVRRFQNRGHDLEDLFQIGVIGLIKAIDRFDLNFNVKFSTYAVPMILGEIQRFLRDDGPVKVTRVLKENAVKVYRAKTKIEAQNGREANLKELSLETGLPAEDIVACMEASKAPASIQEPINHEQDDSGPRLMDQIKSDEEEGRWLNHIALRQAIETLDPRDREIIQLRFFQDRTQNEVAQIVGLSQVQISRLERQILKRFKAILVY